MIITGHRESMDVDEGNIHHQLYIFGHQDEEDESSESH